MKDDLGKRMKSNYEDRTRFYLPRRTFTIIRIDGKAFHSYTRGLNKPFDINLMNDMDTTAIHLCKNIQGCKFAYVQSDEISLLLTDFTEITTDAWFDGNIQKIVSISASLATSHFNYIRMLRYSSTKWITTYLNANFDSRVFTIPDKIEVENYFIWRQKDAIRNSISMTAQSLYSHKQLEGKSQSDMQEMCFQKGINWNDMPNGFKRGRTIIKEDNWVVNFPDFLKQREQLTDLINN